MSSSYKKYFPWCFCNKEIVHEETENILADQVVSDTSDLLKQCMETLLETEVFKKLDHIYNRDEMVRFLIHLSTCRTKSEVQIFFDLWPKLTYAVGSFIIVMACLDTGFFDLYSLYCFFTEDHPYLFMSALILLAISAVVQVIRIIDIGQEIHNLRKMLKAGFYPNAKIRPYDITNTPRPVKIFLKTFKLVFPFPTWNNVEIQDPEAEVNELEGYTPTTDGFSLDEMKELFWIIDDSTHAIPIAFYCFLPSIPLHLLVMKRTRRLVQLLENPDSWKCTHVLLKIYCEAAFLTLIRFEAAEMTLTELAVEVIPQFVVGTIPFAHQLVSNGVWTTFNTAPLYKLALFVISIGSLGVSMVMGTLGKLKFYFQVYDQGVEFQNVKEKVKVMDYTIVNKLISIFGHVLTIGSTLLVLALSCTSSLGPLPFLLLGLGYVRVFYISTPTEPIPFYEAYLTWTNIFSTLNVKLPEMFPKNTFWTLAKKIGWFSVVVGFSGILFFLELLLRDLNDHEHRWNLFLLLGSIFLIYFLGSLILLADRLYWQYTWGENFYHYLKYKLN